MKLRLVIVAIVFGLIAGCATSPKQAYMATQKISQFSKYGEKEVVSNAEKIPLPTTIHGISFSRKSFEIVKEDPVIDFGDYKSHYKLFNFKANKGETFRISIMSLCDCLGFRKFILVPNVYVADSDGNFIETKITKSTSSLSSVELILDGQAAYNGEYHLVIAANNSSPGQNVAAGQAMANGYIPTGIYVSNSSHPYGKVIPSFEITQN